MKKTFLFLLSISVAFGITLFIKKERANVDVVKTEEWKTFIKKDNQVISTHATTPEEFHAAKIPAPLTKPSNRDPASVKPIKGFMLRQGRILMGEIDAKYEDDSTPLKLTNKHNPKWKDIVGVELMKFQPEETKVIVKEEVPVIKIEENKGTLLEQISVTLMQKNGFNKSFRALVNSETGEFVSIWDRTIHEHSKDRSDNRGELTLPAVNESGITIN